MEDNKLYVSIVHLIERINSINEISEHGLQETQFPDEVILSLHNHMGNAHHFVDDINTAFNATEQYMSITAAQKELREMGDDLFKLSQNSVIPMLEYEALIKLTLEVDEELRKLTDEDYS